MADSKQLKRIDPVDFGDDDPFAELTKIMGFDPRVPVPAATSATRVPPQAESRAVMSPVAAAPEPELDFSADDFSIDLEKELLGEFAVEEDEPAEAVAAPPVVAAAEPVFEDADAVSEPDLDLSLDVAFAADLDEELSLDRSEPVIADAADETEHEDLLADFEVAFEEDLVGDEEPAHIEEPLRADDEQPGEEELSAEDAELVAALEPADLAESVEPFLEEPAPVQTGAPRDLMAEEIDLDLDFDVAMAEVDMDFSADPEVQPYRAEPNQAESYRTDSYQTDPYQAGAIDFDDFDETAIDEADAVEPAPAEPVDAPLEAVQLAEAAEELRAEAVSDGGDPEELSLEDELNALLGNSVPKAELTGGYDAPPLTAAFVAPEAPATDDRTDFETDLADFEADLAAWDPDAPVAGDDSAAETHAAEPEAYSAGREAYAAEPRAYAAASGTYAVEEADDDYAGPSYQVAEVEYAEDEQEAALLGAEAVNEPAAEDELDFDDGAFHAAFENSLVSDDRSDGPEDLAPEATEDPFATLQQMTAKAAPAEADEDFDYYRSHATPSPSYARAAPLAPVSGGHAIAAASDEDIPDIDTVDVPETAVAMADDLDIPELAYEDEVRAAPAYDEFEPEFAAAYADPAQAEEVSLRSADADSYAPVERDYGQRYAEPQVRQDHAGYGYAAAAAATAAGAAYASTGRAADRSDFDAGDDEFDAADLPGSRQPAGRDVDDFDALDYDDDLDEEIALPAYAEQRARPQRRGLLLAAIVGGVAIIGGLGAFALSFGGSSGSDVPAIVRADDSPIKVRPENPGGTTVPNQDNKVYETVAGDKGRAAPAQEKLITSAEEPVDVTARAPEPAPIPDTAPDAAQPTDTGSVRAAAPEPDARAVDLPGVGDEIGQIAAKAEDRVEPSVDAEQPGTDNTEVAAVAPRRVRTMVVRADGTLVPREDPAPEAAPAAAEPQAAADAMMESAPATSIPEPEVTNTTGPTFQAPGAQPVPVETVAPAKPTKSAPKAASSSTPASVPVAPSRPADQPVDVVGEVKPEQVAAVSPTAAPVGTWSMQIASQPSEDAAKSTYQDLARRYANVIGGRGATIVKAEVAGKGTFWRVRVPAGSRNEAINLCESYKSAGGNCFVSK